MTLAACAAPDDRCAARAEAALYYGVEEPLHLALGVDQEAAVVALRDTAGEVACSGVIVASNLVLTAKHCLQRLADWDAIAVELIEGEADTRAALAGIHPFADIAALTLLDTAVALRSAQPIPPLANGTALRIGQRVTAAGHGLTELDELVGRRFLTTTIADVRDDEITIDGHGLGGACTGDSGGPLLTRADDGSVRVAGLLSSGAATCVEWDRYTRVDQVAPWLAGLARTGEATRDCGEIDGVGRCFDGLSVWCQDGRLRAERCVETRACGWSPSVGGYRCVGPDNPCRGADDFGRCEGNTRLRCDHGAVESRDCGGCGTCTTIASGRARCVAP